jgi:hypothetical protein
MSVSYYVNHELQVQRCYECGRYWAREGTSACGCPYCTEVARRETIAREMKLERRIYALKGVITKLRGRR